MKEEEQKQITLILSEKKEIIFRLLNQRTQQMILAIAGKRNGRVLLSKTQNILSMFPIWEHYSINIFYSINR